MVNTIQTASACGFVRPDQAAVLKPYVDRYFAEAPEFFGRIFASAKLVVAPLPPRLRADLGEAAPVVLRHTGARLLLRWRQLTSPRSPAAPG